MMTLTEQENHVSELRNQLAAAEVDLERARLAVAGVSIGDIVQSSDAPKWWNDTPPCGGIFRVKAIRTMATGKAWVSGARLNENGTWSPYVTELGSDWEVCQIDYVGTVTYL